VEAKISTASEDRDEMLPTKSNFEAEVSMEREAIPVPEDPPFLVLLAGDYSGRANLARTTDAVLRAPSPIEVDRDNFEDVLKRLNVGIRIEPGGEGTGIIPLNFTSLDDFHPDNIFKRVPLFADLRDVRKRLMDPDEFDAAAREVRSWLDDEAEEEKEEGVADEPLAEAASGGGSYVSGDLLDDIIGKTKRDAASYPTQPTEKTPLSKLVRELVRPHLITTDEAEQDKLVAVVDEMTGDLMRKIVHDPEFRELEAAWRGLYLVVRRVETDSELRIYLLDLSKDELANDLKNVAELTESDYFETVTRSSRESAGGEPWALICGNYGFALNIEDAATLMRLAKISGAVNAPFISHVRPQMLGIESIADHPIPAEWDLESETEAGKLWKMLRTMPEAVNLGLAVPRFLLRLPYGEETEPAEAFAFEELTEDGKHDQYLWGNPSFLCGLLLAQSFRAAGWEINGRYYLDVDRLPTHVYTEDGDTRTKPCGEIEMTHEACDTLIEQGLMPVISYKDTDRVRVGGIHSIAFPAKGLNGRWS